MRISSLGFRTDLMIRRMAGSVLEDRGDWMVVRTPTNPAFWWGNFLLFPAPPRSGDVTRWLAMFRTEFPHARHRAFGVDGTAGDTGMEEELDSLGVKADVSVVLTAARLRRPPALAGNCRRLASDDDWRQLLQLRRRVHDQPDDPASTTFLLGQVAEARGLVEQGHGAWFGAFVADRLASALGILSDGSGLARYQSVETHPDHRRQGLARSLMYEAGRYALEVHHAVTLVILADPNYHAVDLYRSLGFAGSELQVQLQGAEQVA